MRLCVHCSHAVSLGDRHALENCPPPRGRHGEKARRLRIRRKRNRRDLVARLNAERGKQVAFNRDAKGRIVGVKAEVTA